MKAKEKSKITYRCLMYYRRVVAAILSLSTSIIATAETFAADKASFGGDDGAGVKAEEFPQKQKLANGLEVVWFESQNLPLIDFEYVFMNGHADDPKGKSGLAELLTAGLPLGTDGVGEVQLARRIEALGASRGAAVSGDLLDISVHGLSRDSDELLTFVTKMIQKPDFPEAPLNREKRRMIEAWKRVWDSSEALGDLTLQSFLTAKSRYWRGNLASIQELEKITPADLKTAAQAWFRPERALLVVIGKADRPKIIARLTELWSGEGAKGTGATGVAPPALSQRLQPTKKVTLIARDSQNQVQIRYGARLDLDRFRKNCQALSVGSAILGGYFNSKLNALIREKLGLSYGVSSSVVEVSGLAALTIQTHTRAEMAGEVFTQIDGVLASMANGEISDEEVGTARDFLRGGFPLSVATPQGLAAKWLTYRMLGLPENTVFQYTDEVAKITGDDVRKAWKEVVGQAMWSKIAVGPSQVMEKSLKSKGYSEFSHSMLLRPSK